MRLQVGLGTVLAVLSAAPATAQDFRAYNHPHMWGGGYDGGLMFFGPILMLVLLAALVVGILALLRWMSGKPGAEADAVSDALAILNQRLAKGEIDAKEYSERKALLQS